MKPEFCICPSAAHLQPKPSQFLHYQVWKEWPPSISRGLTCLWSVWIHFLWLHLGLGNQHGHVFVTAEQCSPRSSWGPSGGSSLWTVGWIIEQILLRQLVLSGLGLDRVWPVDRKKLVQTSYSVFRMTDESSYLKKKVLSIVKLALIFSRVKIQTCIFTATQHSGCKVYFVALCVAFNILSFLFSPPSPFFPRSQITYSPNKRIII